MADDDYNKKLGEMQKYVPFLETTIKRLKTEKDKPREAQISKLQSLLVILTDSKKKLKLDALKKCEEVILKLYDKVEKKPPVTMMHKYMCRTPPEEKSLLNLNLNENSQSGFDTTFLVARQKLKQTDTTPASPSPPLDQQIIIVKPIVIPTEKVTSNTEQQPSQYPQNWENYQNIPQTLNWPINAFNPEYTSNLNKVWHDPNSENWTMPSNDPNWSQSELYKRRIESDSKNDVWDRETLTSNSYKQKQIDREIVNYSDATISVEPVEKCSPTKIKIVGNNKEIIPIPIDSCPKKSNKHKNVNRKSLPLPPAPQSPKSLEKEILPFNKPPLSDRDIRDLLSTATEHSSEDQSTIFNEDMDLDKLEALKAKLYKELQSEKPKHKKKTKDKEKLKSPTPVIVPLPEIKNPSPPVSNQAPITKKPIKVPERVFKEANNVFGSLLSSIDEQIMYKNKDKKCDKKEPKKEEIKKVLTKDPPKIIDKKECPKESKALNVKDVASMNEKVKSIHLKSEEPKEKKTDIYLAKVDNKKAEASKPKEAKKPLNKDKVENKVKAVNKKTEEVTIPKKNDVKVFKTVENIMKNLKDSINKPSIAMTIADPLSKFGDLVKEKSDQLCDNKAVEVPSSGRLSDKYPHKRKSIESRSSDSPLNDSNNTPKIPPEPVKLSDPRLRNTKAPVLVSPPIKEPSPSQSNRNIEINRHDFDQRNFKNPEFSFQQHNYSNMNPNNFNQRGGPNNIFCNNEPLPPLMRPLNELHHMPQFPQEDAFQNVGCRNAGARNPGEAFLNSCPRTPIDSFNTPGDQFMNPGPPRTPVDPFLNSGDQFINAGPPRTPGDPFLNSGPPRTPGDPFMNSGPPRTPGDPFINSGPPRTPGDQFMSPGDPFLNQGRPPGPNFNQFPNEPMRNQFRNDFPINRNPDFNPNHERFNPNWNRPNQFPPNIQNPQNPQNQRFNHPPDQNINQYDLSQMNPIDFYDNNNHHQNNNNRFEPEFNSFRGGRGNCNNNNNNRGNFGRGRGGPPPDRDRSSYRDPRQFRMPMPLPLNKFSPNEESASHKEENRRTRFDDPRDLRDHRGDRDFRRSRFNKEEEHWNDRSRNCDDRYNRFNKWEEPIRKPGFVREDPRRKSVEDVVVVDKPKEKETIVSVEKAIDEKPIDEKPMIEKPLILEVVKPKEEIQSPLDSLYSTETKRVGKGYGLQSFKIPKIKKNEEIKEEKDTKTSEEEVKMDPKSPDKTDEIIPEAGPSKQNDEPIESPKTEADVKLDMFNNFMKQIFETCDSSVLLEYLDRCGFSLPNAKTKRIRRIINSDSSDTEDEHKKEDSETDKPTPEPPAETPEPESPKANEPEKIVETLSERIKNRRRKPVLYSSDSSSDKSQIKAPTPTPNTVTNKETEGPDLNENQEQKQEQEQEQEREEEQEKETQKIRSCNIKQIVKTKTKTRRKNALELLQEDIREMFISEGVLTATGKRMCRMMKEHQESGLIPNTPEEMKQQKNVEESDEEAPLIKRKDKQLKAIKQEKSPEIIKRSTRKSPRVVLEKMEIVSKLETRTSSSLSLDHSDKESETESETTDMKKPNILPTRHTRRSNTISGEFLELDENGIVAKVQDKKKKNELERLDNSFEDDVSVKSETVAVKLPETEITDEEIKEEVPVIRKKKIRRRGRGGWATGVIKNKKKKNKCLEKNRESPALTVSTEKSESNDDDDDDDDNNENNENNDEDLGINKSEIFDEEYSLLKLDMNKDVNYFLDNGNKFDCKLCGYKGKLIVHHYRSKHPESENMISRLSPEQASAAKIESKEFNFEEIVPYEETTRGKKRRTTFICRFCLLTFKQEFTCSFFDHICCHTGEYRYKCNMCTFTTGVRKTLSTHCHSLHPNKEKPFAIKPIYEGPPNFRLVFGHLCSACNFTQLLKQNVEKHIRVSHPNQDITIIKISMSTKPIPLVGLKKLEEIDKEEVEPKLEPTTPETPKKKKLKQLMESPKTSKQSLNVQMEVEDASPQKEKGKEKEPNLTVFMVPEEISQQEKLIESERLKKMEEIQSNVVPRRSKLQFVDKLKNKLDSVESEIALLESMEAENAALEAEAEADAEAKKVEEIIPETSDDFISFESTPKISDILEENWISIASTCSLANIDQLEEHLFDDEPKDHSEPEPEEEETHFEDLQESLNETNFDDLETESFESLSQNTKKSGFLDTIQRLAAQLQNNKTSSLSDCDDNDDSPEEKEIVTPESSPELLTHLEQTEFDETIKINATYIEIQFFSDKNVYTCLVSNCYFTTNLKANFRKHLMHNHKDLRVTCKLCVDEIDFMEWDLCGLFLHMLDEHKPIKQQSPNLQVKQEPPEQPELPIKSELVSPEKTETLQPGSIRLRRISGDLLSSFSVEDAAVEYPTISIPETVVSEPDINQMLGEEVEAQAQAQAPINETSFLQISNVRTLTPEEENHLQIKTLKSPVRGVPKKYKKIMPKTFILNVGDLATNTGVTKLVNNVGSAINFKRATVKEGTTYNFTLKATNETTPSAAAAAAAASSSQTTSQTTQSQSPSLITNDSKATKTIIFRNKCFETSNHPGLKPPNVATKNNNKGFITTGTKLQTTSMVRKKITLVSPSSTTTPLETPTTPPPDNTNKKAKVLEPLRLNKSEFTLSIMTEYPKIMEFYKCPCLECVFSTNDRNKFQEHFNGHKRTSAGKYCVYCVSTVQPIDLIDHLEKRHGNCLFQCALCFYRASFDMYIAVHQSSCHQLDIPKFYTVPPNPILNIKASGLEDELLPRTSAITPYYCTTDGCYRTFYTVNDFRVHMKIFHKRDNICSFCKLESSNVELLIGHYVTHNIANFQCRYCKFGTEKPRILLKHHAIEHYNKNPIVYKRDFKSGATTNSHPNDASRLDDIIEINLSYLVKPIRCIPQKPLETQNHIPAPTSPTFEEISEEMSDEGPSPTKLIIPEKSTTEELLIDPTTGELIPTIEKELNEPEITLKHRNEETLQAIVDAVDPLNLDETINEMNDVDVNVDDDNDTERETETEIETDVYENSGLTGCELFVCGTSDCNTKLSNLKDFKTHMHSCDVLTDMGWYTCFHCKKRFKNVRALIKHLIVHESQKYTCSLCSTKTHLEILIIKHMKIQHNVPLLKVVPIDKTNPDSDFVAVEISRAKQVKTSKKNDKLYEKVLQDAIKHTKEQIELFESDVNTGKIPIKSTKVDDKNSFGPEDIDKLPRPPIFAQEIRCKICSYNTKVRSNMLKHLNAHIENKPVAETAPVNPVPCLEKNELMFDKMTNLAASSHSGGRMGGLKKEDKKNKDKTLILDFPGFIAASKRYVCGSTGCNYLTHGDSMLRHHLSALHIDEATYKCPHCQIDLAPDRLNIQAVDNILFHLKMHDLHLYKCNECQFIHYQKHKMEKHLLNKHHQSSNSFTIIRELDNSANSSNSSNLEEPPPRSVISTPMNPEKTSPETDEFQPWRCGFCDFKTATRTVVQSHAANIHKIRSQFKCGACEFRCSAKNNYQTHFKNKHPKEKVAIMSVYFKITTDESNLSNISNLSNSDIETTTTTNKNFDTTPLWTKNKTGVKHIRGILLDDSPIAKRPPRILEKIKPSSSDHDNNTNHKKSTETSHNLRFPATYGSNRLKFYVCPTCNTFETKNSKQFVIHLYKEINYFRYMCNFCLHKSTHMAEAQKHFKQFHSTETIISNKEICTVLRYFAKAEKWVEKCLQIQQEGIQKYESLIQIKEEQSVNSSTETLILECDEISGKSESESESETELNLDLLEKPILTPQQRRSSRATTTNIKVTLNENIDSNESLKIDELLPPILEPQIITTDSTLNKKNPLKCEHCPFVAKTAVNLEKHAKKHFETKPFKCNLCSYSGGQLAHLQSHFYFKHTSEPLQYTVDPTPTAPRARPPKRKRTMSRDDLLSPNDVVDNMKFYVCMHCPRRSPTLQLIREHCVEAHEKLHKNIFKYKKLTINKPKKTKYSCPNCDWTGHPDALKNHHLTKHTDKEYICAKIITLKCELCPEVFRKLSLLKKHFYRNHLGCNLMYQNVMKENDDEYIETFEYIEEVLEVKPENQEQEINCEYCVLSFLDLNSLRAHHDLVHNHLEFNHQNLNVDNEEASLKKYKCPQCPHTSNSFPAMRDHIRNHNKPYKCGHCDLTASYPSLIKTHHMKEHFNLEPIVSIVSEAQKRNEQLRDDLLHLQNGEYVKMKDNLKRPNTDVINPDEPPTKVLIIDEDDPPIDQKDQKKTKPKLKHRRKSIASTTTIIPVTQKVINVAKKSTATPPRIQNVAKKSTTPRALVNQGFSYYGTKPMPFDEIKNIVTELPIMGKNVPLNIGSMSQILQLFPVVVLEDIYNNKNT